MELDEGAWTRWIAYRIAIKKPLKPMSEEAAKLKLMRWGAEQCAVVEQSIANQWTGLFDLRKEKNGAEPKKRTKEESDVRARHLEWVDRESAKLWDKELKTHGTVGKLLLLDALLARYDAEADQSSTVLAEKREWLSTRAAELLREADPSAVLSNYCARRLVLRLFNAKGLRRLEHRLQERAA